MKKIQFIFVMIIVPLVLGSWYSVTKYVPRNPLAKAYTIEGKTYMLLEAKTPAEWTKGLMYVRRKEGFDGMIFLFPDKSERTFWNKNTYSDLDLLWMDDETVVGKSPLPSIEKTKTTVTVSSPRAANKVVELIR
jgi:uncharacterized membrane protein (UPF0127 family)